MKSYTNMLAIIKIFPSFLLLFLYVYPLFLVGIPISTRVALGGLGFVWFVLRIKFYPSFFCIFKGAIPILLASVFAGVVNHTFDFFFAYYVGSIFLIYFAAYFFIVTFSELVKKSDYLTLVLNLFVWVVVLQSLLALLMYLLPGFNELLHTIFPMQDTSKLEEVEGMRLIGLGIAFFEAGVINGLALIVIVYLYLAGWIKRAFLWVCMYMFIFFIGLMMARTTVIGFGLSAILFLCWRPLHIPTLKHKTKWLFLVVIILISTVILIFAFIDEQLLMFAFEFYYRFEATGSFESASTNQLQEMYVFPIQLRTWLVGDGIYNLPDGHYYMSTDVGYLRLLFYGGIPMVVAFYYFPWYIICQMKKMGISPLLWKFLVVVFLYLLILGLKGLANINFLFLLLFACHYQQQKICSFKSM